MPLTGRQAKKLALAMGAQFIRHGAEHDLYRAKDGAIFAIPRHPGDLSPGVEREIKKKLGLL